MDGMDGRAQPQSSELAHPGLRPSKSIRFAIAVTQSQTKCGKECINVTTNLNNQTKCEGLLCMKCLIDKNKTETWQNSFVRTLSPYPRCLFAFT